MKKIFLMLFLIIIAGCTNLPTVEQGTVEEKVDSTGAIVKVLTNYREEIDTSYGNEKTMIYNGTVKNGKFTGIRKTEGVRDYERKIILEETVKNDKVLEKKYDEYKEKNKNGETVVIKGIEKNGRFTGTKKILKLEKSPAFAFKVETEVSITEKIENNRVLSKTGNLKVEYYDYNTFSKNELIDGVDIEWYKEKIIGDIKEIEVQNMYFIVTEEVVKKWKPGFILKTNALNILKQERIKTYDAYIRIGSLSFINYDEDGYLKLPKKVKAKYNMKTGKFIEFEFYFKDKKVNTSKMSNSEKKKLYDNLYKKQLDVVQKRKELCEIDIMEEQRKLQQRREFAEALTEGLQQAADAYERTKAQNEYRDLQQQRMENTQEAIRKYQMRLEERKIMNSSNYSTNADRHKAVVESWNKY